MKNLRTLDAHRISGEPVKYPENEGRFIIPVESSGKAIYLRIIACSAQGWDHVSVSLEDRIPTWNEMCHVKRLFFKDDETVMQLHPPETDYVNDHPFVLHLWRPHSKLRRIPMPPKWMV